MSIGRIVGVLILLAGLTLLALGYRGSHSAFEQLSYRFSGNFTEQTMWYLVTGVAAVAGGIFLLLFGKRVD
jgi:Protein of unknown function (DUF3185)